MVNGESREVPDDSTLMQALDQLGFGKGSFAVAVNLNFISRSDYGKTILKSGDELEVVTPRQGG